MQEYGQAERYCTVAKAKLEAARGMENSVVTESKEDRIPGWAAREVKCSNPCLAGVPHLSCPSSPPFHSQGPEENQVHPQS